MSPADSSRQPGSPQRPRDPESERGADLGRFVPGIYNYCDRWCERCPATAKCQLYWQDTQTAAGRGAAGRDPERWAVVLEDVKQQFERAITLLRQAAEVHGVDLDRLPRGDFASADPRGHPLHQRAEAYAREAHGFLAEFHRRLLQEHAAMQDRALVLGPERAVAEHDAMLDAYKIVSWYHTLIPAKVHRALGSRTEAGAGPDAEEREFHRRDAQGSARVAHDGVVRSLAALRVAYDWDQGLEDRVIPLLADLDWIRQEIEAAFPDFRRFKRPGLDPEDPPAQPSIPPRRP